MNMKLLPETVFIIIGVIAVIVAICSIVAAMRIIRKRKANTKQDESEDTEYGGDEENEEPFVEIPPSNINEMPYQPTHITTQPINSQSSTFAQGQSKIESSTFAQGQPTVKRSVTFVSFGFSGTPPMVTTPDTFNLDDEPPKSSPRIVEIEDSDSDDRQMDDKITKTVEKITTEAKDESQKKKHKKHHKDKQVKESEPKKDDVITFTNESSPKNILEIDTDVDEDAKNVDNGGVDYVD